MRLSAEEYDTIDRMYMELAGVEEDDEEFEAERRRGAWAAVIVIGIIIALMLVATIYVSRNGLPWQHTEYSFYNVTAELNQDSEDRAVVDVSITAKWFVPKAHATVSVLDKAGNAVFETGRPIYHLKKDEPESFSIQIKEAEALEAIRDGDHITQISINEDDVPVSEWLFSYYQSILLK